MKRLFISAFMAFLAVSCLQEERSPEDILVPSLVQVGCSDSPFSLTSKVPVGSQKLVDECGFLVGATKDLVDAVVVECTMNENTFTAELPTRKYGSTYYICSYVTNGHGSEIRSDVCCFALESLDNYVEYGALTVVSYDEIIQRAEIAFEMNICEGIEVSEVGLCYGDSQALSVEGDHTVGLYSDDGNVYVSINDLIDGNQYYICPYIRDNEYLAYGHTVEFIIPAVPFVETDDATEITSVSAILSGEVVKGADISERGFILIEGEGPVVDMKHKKVVEGTIGEYMLELKALLPNQKYSFCAYAVNPTGTYYGTVKSFTTMVDMPEVASVVVSSVTATSATLSSVVKNHGGEIVSEVGFYYSTEETVNIETATKVSQPYSQDAFSIEVNDLAANTKYYVMSYVRNSAGESYSAIESFYTSSSIPTVRTVGYSDVTSDSSVLIGIVDSANGKDITERGFVWTSGTVIPTIDSYKLKVEGATGEYVGILTGLDPNEEYSFRAYAKNSNGIAYGDKYSFVTSISKPSLSATKVVDVKTTSALFTATVTDDGGAQISDVGFYYSIYPEVDILSAQKVSQQYTDNNFTLEVTDLDVSTDYYVKAFAVNAAGEVYNDVVSFKTASMAPLVTTVGYSNVSTTSAEILGKVEDDYKEPIIECGFLWVKGESLQVVSSNKLQVDGNLGPFTAMLNDIDPNQIYSFCAYARNSQGTSYGEVLSFKTEVALPELENIGYADVTSSSVTVSAKVVYYGGDAISKVGFLYGTSKDLDPLSSSIMSESYSEDLFTFNIKGLSRAKKYYVRPYAINSAGTAYGDVFSFTTLPELPVVETSDITDITDKSAVSGGVIWDDGGVDIISKGVVWSKRSNPTVDLQTKTEEGGGKSSFSSNIHSLLSGVTYYVRAYATNSRGTSYGEEKQFVVSGEISATDISYKGTANCYIISSSGAYCFPSVRGNSMEYVEDAYSAEVLWESFGTSTVPDVGELIESVLYNNKKIYFFVNDVYKEGNAVIAVKDEWGTVLWSWHIWLTDQPDEHFYINEAGIMMDRNLGATSPLPGEVGALGLLYQHHRKDPFLGSSSIQESVEAKSTIIWPSYVIANSYYGTVQYSIENPTTFICCDPWNMEGSKFDWLYGWNEDAKWGRIKTMYDPCPPGWRIPDGDFWENASFADSTYDKANKGLFVKLLDSGIAWYPTSGNQSGEYGGLRYSGEFGFYWSLWSTLSLFFSSTNVAVEYENSYAYEGSSVRCQKE